MTAQRRHAPSGHRPVTTTTVYSDTADESLENPNAVYATMRTDGSTGYTRGGDRLRVGQGNFGDYYGFQSFISFDTSAVGTDTVSVVVLSLVPQAKQVSSSDYVAEVYAFDWGATVTTADWRAPSDLTTLLASQDSTASTDDVRTDFTSTVDFPAAIVGSGSSLFVIVSDRFRVGTVPSGTQEGTYFYDSETSGTTSDPKLVVTHAAAGPAGPPDDPPGDNRERQRRFNVYRM